MSFTVDTIKENDKNISGFAQPSEQLKIEYVIKNQTDIINTDENGNFAIPVADEFLENINFNINNVSGVKLGEHWRGDITFYGDNTVNVSDTDNAMEFRKLIVANNASLNLNYRGTGHALNFVEQNDESQKEYGIEVRDNGYLNINSNSGISTTDLPGGYDYHMKFQNGTTAILQGNGTNILNNTETNTQALDINIDSVKEVDFINVNASGRLFSIEHLTRFYVQNASVHSWDSGTISEEPTSISRVIEQGQFNFSGNSTIVNNMMPTLFEFSNNHHPNVQRMKFSDTGSHDIHISVQDIYDTSREITGQTNPGAIVQIFDADNNISATTTANNNGIYIFNLETPFKKGEIIRIQAKLDYSQSEIINSTVIGNRLELINVPSEIIFNDTEIVYEEIEIERVEPILSMSVMDTRDNSDWHLTVKALRPLTNSGGSKLDNAIYFNGISIEKEALVIASKNLSSDEEAQNLRWMEDEGLLLRLNPINVVPDTEYSTAIDWTLTDGPSSTN